MGVSAGGGMIHYVLLTTDEVGRSILDTRVIDVDPADGLDAPDRVNAGIDLMLSAARDAGRRVGPIGVATRPDKARRSLRSRGAGPRRQITLVDDDAAVVEYLVASGEIERFGCVVVVDCGDTGMSLYAVDPRTRQISHRERIRAISGRKLDGLLASGMLRNATGGVPPTRAFRSALLSACRTAKEELSGATPSSTTTMPSADGETRLVLTAQSVDEAARSLVDDARPELERYAREALSWRPQPEAMVLVGGLANLPAVRATVGDVAGSVDAGTGGTLDVVTPVAPQLVSAFGAALMARRSDHGALAFIGGGRRTGWLSAAPLAVVGALLAAALMTIYAVSSSLTGNQAPEPTVTSSSQAPTAENPTSTPTTTIVMTTDVVVPEDRQPVDQPTYGTVPPRTEPRWNEGPGWATTQLPRTTTPSTTTRTLVPYPVPTLPWGNDRNRPTIPTDLIPPDLLPQESRTPPPPPLMTPRIAPPRPVPPRPPGSATPTVPGSTTTPEVAPAR